MIADFIYILGAGAAPPESGGGFSWLFWLIPLLTLVVLFWGRKQDHSPLRLVLFGIAKSGKSSLLGALGRIQAENPQALRGDLIDRDRRLAKKRESTYQLGSPRTEEEVDAVSVELKPVEMSGKKSSVSAEIIDSDGHIAAQILVGQRPLRGKHKTPDMGNQIWNADALLIPIDIASSQEYQEKVLKAFERFLIDFQKARSKEHQVPGLPVFLVLTKCDLVAQPEDSLVDWLERVEQNKGEIHARLSEKIIDQLEIVLWGTAIRRPALGNKPSSSDPYMVAELFFTAFQEAQKHRNERNRATRPPVWRCLSWLGQLFKRPRRATVAPAENEMPPTPSTPISVVAPQSKVKKTEEVIPKTRRAPISRSTSASRAGNENRNGSRRSPTLTAQPKKSSKKHRSQRAQPFKK